MSDSPSSIPSLFSGEDTSIEYILGYLHKNESRGVQDFLINRLYDFPSDQVVNFLPQLVNISIQREDCESYTSFFLDTAIKNHFFAVKLYWLLQANLLDCQNQFVKKLEHIIHSLEKAIVDGQRHRRSSGYQPPHLFALNIAETEEELLIHKRARAEYFTDQHKLANTLAKISITLIGVPNDEKDSMLRAYIQNVDTWIKDTRFWYKRSEKSLYIQRIYRGIVLPIEFQGSDSKIEQIVSIPSEESKCFKTKARVPYKIIIETIDINEDDLNETEPASPQVAPKSEIIEGLNVEDLESSLIDKNEARFAGFEEYARKARPDKEDRQDVISMAGSDGSEETPWGESWEETKARLQASSAFGYYKSWNARAVIVKGHDDLRQELLAMQIIRKSKEIFLEAGLSIYLRPYDILIVSHNSGLIECVPDAVSLHSIKKNTKNYTNLRDFFARTWDTSFEEAQRNFVESMAGYSLVCYILNLKDRHNGNILLDSKGHIIHIDFGFFLTNSPGGNINFESAPFKLTKEMIDAMGGYDSEMYVYFKVLLFQGFLALRKQFDKLRLLLDMMKHTNFPCFKHPSRAISDFRSRFQLNLNEDQCLSFINDLVLTAAENWKTVKYDSFQRFTNGILP
ncbi:unnamed protein product [Blepharisma stoltei]|uniref:1-phosphatidylinositol 4-kinase n=1 Tax=Blepharisma stoltei TaxID=1481888 RepID=A0AAU9IG06_9CILI|nr:unnamed protein product [Blepharisma stoltei]